LGGVFWIRCFVELAITSVVALLLMAVAAINRSVFGRLKRQFGDLRAAICASPVTLEHLALKTTLRPLILKGHYFFN